MTVTKMQFLGAVREKTADLPPAEVNRLLEYYNEMIDEAVEEGISEEDAVARLGSWEDICAQIDDFRTIEPEPEPEPAQPTAAESVTETEIPTPAIKPKKHISLPMWAVVLLILTSPVWGAVVLSLGIAVFAVIASLVVVGGALVLSLFAVVLALAVVGVVGIPAAVVILFNGSIAPFLLTLGGALICVALAILGEWILIPLISCFVACVKTGFSRIIRCFR